MAFCSACESEISKKHNSLGAEFTVLVGSGKYLEAYRKFNELQNENPSDEFINSLLDKIDEPVSKKMVDDVLHNKKITKMVYVIYPHANTLGVTQTELDEINKNKFAQKFDRLYEAASKYTSAVLRQSEAQFAHEAFASISQDTPYIYSLAQDKLKYYKDTVSYRRLETAKEKYEKGEYIDAYENLIQARLFNPDIEEVVGLVPIYEEKYKTAKEEKDEKDTIRQEEEKRRQEEERQKREAQKAEDERKEKERKKSQGVRVGMSKQDVLDSSWGQPNDINTTTTKYGVREQWVYDGGYLYFEDGVLTAIQN